MDKVLVQKFGGATLSDPQKIKSIAKKISELHSQGKKLIIVVSAMGKTTNTLIDLAHQVSPSPSRRELDMLLTTGERISMSLMSIALHDLGCPAISFTGSQAGILTNESHLNAYIKDIKPVRIEAALHENQVVVLAGFQGVSPQTKEITTLGRGGSDTSAVAIAAFFNAERCEILKDVPSVFSADPTLVSKAHPLKQLTYRQLLEMTFWGAKVLHYRSVELALQKNVNLYIGPAHSHQTGTFVTKESSMYETSNIMALNSHEHALELELREKTIVKAQRKFQQWLDDNQIGAPQTLLCQIHEENIRMLIVGPLETLSAIEKNSTDVQSNYLSTITATCTGTSSSEILEKLLKSLEEISVTPKEVLIGPMSITLVIERAQRVQSLNHLHNLIGIK